MTDYTATPKQWAEIEHWSDEYGYAPQTCILELRARVKTLEDTVQKHIAETNSNIVALFSRVESLEAAERQTSKVYSMADTTPLSPAAAAVLNAYDSAPFVDYDIGDRASIAAALRAAADQVVPPALEEEFFDRNHALPLQKKVEIRLSLLAIAAELDGGAQ